MADHDVDEDYTRLKTYNFAGNGSKEPTNWKKGDLIGHGAFGKVYKATVGDVIIAVKKVPNVSHLDKRKEDTITKEKEALMKLSHERIITYYGFCVANQMFYIFLEFMKGGSLHDFIGRRNQNDEQIDEAHASRITVQIVQGVDYLHENKLFHRDIKSANILMSDEESVKLADFGLTRTFEEVSKTYTKGVGTDRFMAPERVIPERHYGNPVDIWAIGCIVVHMLSGKIPYAGLEDQQIPIKLLTDPKPAKDIFPTVSESCQRFLQKSLAIDPAKRATAKSLLRDHFVTGTELPDVEIDADLDNSESDNELEVLNTGRKIIAEPKQQTGAINFNYSQQHYETNQTYNIQGDVKFKKDVHVDKIETLKVERLENLHANKVENLEAHGARAIDVSEATKIKATAENLQIKQAGTVNAAQNSNLNVAQAETLNAEQANVINIENLEYLHIS